MSILSQDDLDSLLGNQGTAGAEQSAPPQAANSSETLVVKAELETDPAVRDLEFILDIPLEVTVELGRARMVVNELLQLGQGSVVELTRQADEPMDVYVNGKLFARGEVVVVNEKFGVRLTDIVSPAERVKNLG